MKASARETVMVFVIIDSKRLYHRNKTPASRWGCGAPKPYVHLLDVWDNPPSRNWAVASVKEYGMGSFPGHVDKINSEGFLVYQHSTNSF